MEDRLQVITNGQSVLTTDLNLVGQVAALADDRVFAELLRLAPYDGATVRRGIVPYGHALSGNAAMVAPNGASGSVLVNPFRAFIGSRTAVASDAKLNWRDVRSAVSVGTTTLGQVVALAANASGNPRWDLVYVGVAVDANGASVTRKVKDPTTKVIAAVSVVTTLVTTATLGVVAGTPGASPAFPALPSDAGGIYYVPLAYVRIPNGFGAASAVLNKDVNEVSPVLTLARGAGPRPADQHNVGGGTAISGAGTSGYAGPPLTWTGTAGARPELYLPPSMRGGETIFTFLDFTAGATVNWSHQNNAIVDASCDWRYRVFKWQVQARGVGIPAPAWVANTGGGSNPGAYAAASQLGATMQIGFGQSFLADGGSQANVVNLGANLTQLGANTVILYVDMTTGALKVAFTGTTHASGFFFWLEASAQFVNL